MPPSQSIEVPVTKLAASLHSHATALPMSMRCPKRGSARAPRMSSASSASVARRARPSVSAMGPGETALTLMPYTPHSSAKQRVSISIPALAEQAWACIGMARSAWGAVMLTSTAPGRLR